MSDIVQRAKDALEGVAPGPWECRGNIWSDPDGAYKLVARINPGGIGPVNAEFIAAARTLVPELVDEIEKLRTEVAFAKDGMEIRPMTAVESNLMTQVLDLRRQLSAHQFQTHSDPS